MNRTVNGVHRPDRSGRGAARLQVRENALARRLLWLLLLLPILPGCGNTWGADSDLSGQSPPWPFDDDDAMPDDDYDEPVCDDYPDPYPNHAIQPGAPVREGLLVDLTPAGLQFIETTALHLAPISIPMESMNQDLGENAGCDVSIGISGMVANADVTHLAIDPISHGLALEVGVLISVNSSGAPFSVQIDADGGLFDMCNLVDQTCGLWIEPMNVSLDMTVWLELVEPGGGQAPYLDAIVSTPSHNLQTALTEDKIGLSGCLISTLNDILDFFGTDMVEMLLNEASGELFDYIEQDLPAMVESGIEGASDTLSVEETVDLGGTPLQVSIVPSGLVIEPDGIRVMLDGAFDAPQAECMLPYDTYGSPDMDIPAPGADGGAHHHAAAFVSDDLINAALYSVWRGGLLCFEADPAELGIPLDTSLLTLLVNEEDRYRLERIWLGEAEPVQIVTIPRNPPINDPAGPHGLDVEVENLGLDLVAMTQDRLSRVVGLEIDVGAGVDLLGLGDGSVVASVALDTDHFHPHVCHNDLVPDLSATIEQNFDSLITTLVEPALAGLLGDITLGPFGFGGLGVASLDLVPAGPTGEYLAAYVDLGMTGSSINLDMGCGDGASGCGEGCTDVSCDQRGAHGGAAAGLVLLGLACLGTIAGLRRFDR